MPHGLCHLASDWLCCEVLTILASVGLHGALRLILPEIQATQECFWNWRCNTKMSVFNPIEMFWPSSNPASYRNHWQVHGIVTTGLLIACLGNFICEACYRGSLLVVDEKLWRWISVLNVEIDTWPAWNSVSKCLQMSPKCKACRDLSAAAKPFASIYPSKSCSIRLNSCPNFKPLRRKWLIDSSHADGRLSSSYGTSPAYGTDAPDDSWSGGLWWVCKFLVL